MEAFPPVSQCGLQVSGLAERSAILDKMGPGPD